MDFCKEMKKFGDKNWIKISKNDKNWTLLRQKLGLEDEYQTNTGQRHN